MELFESVLSKHNIVLERGVFTTLQVNIGKLCNQQCLHCHVEAGPKRLENMERKTVDRLIELLSNDAQIETVDITGGAPELNPHFRYFVKSVRKMGKEVIDRCNLTVLSEKGQEGTAEFLAGEGVQVVASLPCYLKENVEAQRGHGSFALSIAGLQKLNGFGYGKEGSGLILNIVYNPVGVHLPPEQAALEADYRANLQKYGIEFNHLFTITNMPIKRYAEALEKGASKREYLRLLIDNFNPQAATEVMCKTLLSVGWNGQLYDCDFNQMLEIQLNLRSLDIWEIERFKDVGSGISVADHCFGCTAGTGSSCSGALV